MYDYHYKVSSVLGDNRLTWFLTLDLVVEKVGKF